MEKELAIAERVDLGLEDHGILAFNIDFSLESGSRQGTGHFSIQNETGGPLLKKFLWLFGVDDFTQIRGKHVYVLRDNDDRYGQIKGLRTLGMGNDSEVRQFIFQDYFDELKKLGIED